MLPLTIPGTSLKLINYHINEKFKIVAFYLEENGSKNFILIAYNPINRHFAGVEGMKEFIKTYLFKKRTLMKFLRINCHGETKFMNYITSTEFEIWFLAHAIKKLYPFCWKLKSIRNVSE